VSGRTSECVLLFLPSFIMSLYEQHPLRSVEVFSWIPIQSLSGETEENKEKSQDGRSPSLESNPGYPEYEAGLLTTSSRRLA